MRTWLILVCVSLAWACDSGAAQDAEPASTSPAPAVVPAEAKPAAPPAETTFVHANTPENLKQFFEVAWSTPKAATKANIEQLAEHARSVFPTAETYASVVAPELEERDIKRLAKAQELFAAVPDENAARIFLAPDWSEASIVIHSATVADLSTWIIHEDDDEAGEQVPLAEVPYPTVEAFRDSLRGLRSCMQPEVTVYAVEFRGKRSKEIARRLPFIWDGEQWRYLGPFWTGSAMHAALGAAHPLLGKFPGK